MLLLLLMLLQALVKQATIVCRDGSQAGREAGQIHGTRSATKQKFE
jgi:hypothetical protein